MLAMQQTNWWERLATYGWNFVPQTIEQRERVRRSRVNAWIILGLMVLVVILAGMIGVDIGTLVAIVSFVCSLAIAFFLNRAGLVYWTGAILVISFTVAVVLGIILPGALATDDLPAFDLLVIPLIIAGTALPRAFSFLVMAMNSGIIILLYFLLPHTSDLMVDVTSYPSLTVAIITFLGRPIALYVVVAFVEFLWVGSTDRAIRRADQAEALAELERRYADQINRNAMRNNRLLTLTRERRLSSNLVCVSPSASMGMSPMSYCLRDIPILPTRYASIVCCAQLRAKRRTHRSVRNR